MTEPLLMAFQQVWTFLLIPGRTCKHSLLVSLVTGIFLQVNTFLRAWLSQGGFKPVLILWWIRILESTYIFPLNSINPLHTPRFKEKMHFNSRVGNMLQECARKSHCSGFPLSAVSRKKLVSHFFNMQMCALVGLTRVLSFPWVYWPLALTTRKCSTTFIFIYIPDCQKPP